MARAEKDLLRSLNKTHNIAALAEPLADMARLAVALGATPAVSS